MSGMVDIHCHLLPGVDDGPKTWEETLQMCETAAADGITHIVATPHCNDFWSYDREAHQARLDELASRVPALEFTLGCDFHFSYESVQDFKRCPHHYTIGNTHYLLVELSDFGIPQTLSSVFFEMISSGTIPIITHPERNPLIQKRLNLLEEWSALGCLVQITANSLTGRWGSKVKKISEKLVTQGLVNVIASDAHNLGSRPPILSEARKVVAKLAGNEGAASLFLDVPAAIIRGERLI